MKPLRLRIFRHHVARIWRFCMTLNRDCRAGNLEQRNLVALPRVIQMLSCRTPGDSRGYVGPLDKFVGKYFDQKRLNTMPRDRFCLGKISLVQGQRLNHIGRRYWDAIGSARPSADVQTLIIQSLEL